MKTASAATSSDLFKPTLFVPGDVKVFTVGSSVIFDGSREALLALAGNLRRLAITIERKA